MKQEDMRRGGGDGMKDPADVYTHELRLPRARVKPEKPVQLQVMTKGAWRNVIAFDAANDSESSEVMDAAARLGAIGQAALRIVVAAPGYTARPPEVLVYWNPASASWREGPRQ